MKKKTAKGPGDLTRKDYINPAEQEILHSVKTELANLRAQQADTKAWDKEASALVAPNGQPFGGYLLAAVARGALKHYKKQLFGVYGIDADRLILEAEHDIVNPEVKMTWDAFLMLLSILRAGNIVARIDRAEESAKIVNQDVELAIRKAFFADTSPPNWQSDMVMAFIQQMPKELRERAIVRLTAAIVSATSLKWNHRLSDAVNRERGGTSFDKQIKFTLSALLPAVKDHLYPMKEPRKVASREGDTPELVEFRLLRNSTAKYAEGGSLHARASTYADLDGDRRQRNNDGQTDGMEFADGAKLVESDGTDQNMQDEANDAGLVRGEKPLRMGAATDRVVMRKETLRQIDEAFKACGLSGRESQVYELRDQNYTPKQTAEVLGIKVREVWELLTRADKKVKAGMAKLNRNEF
jgi:DNA-directed RNA polymerase specialized sigma24 family protein